MKKLFLILTPLFLLSCVTQTALTPQQSALIPNGATSVRVKSELSKVEIYDKIYQELLKDGYRISQENKEQGLIQTEGRLIEQKTQNRIHIFISSQDGGSLTIFRTDWAIDQTYTSLNSNLTMEVEFLPASWISGGAHRSAIAFASICKFAQRFPGLLTYE